MGDRLRKAREHAGLGQEELAGELGVSRHTLAAYEHDDREPRRAVLMAISMRCSVPLWWFTGADKPGVNTRCFSRRAARPHLVLCEVAA